MTPAPQHGGSADLGVTPAPVWTRYAIDHCELRVAANAVTPLVPVSWRLCSGASLPDTSCRELAIAGQVPSFRAAATLTDGGAMLMIAAELSSGQERYVIQPPDGPPRVVLEVTCAPGVEQDFAIGPEAAAIELLDRRSRVFVAGPFAPTAAWGRPAARLAAGSFALAHLAVAGRSIRGVLPEPQRVVRSSPATAAFASWGVGATFHGDITGLVARGDLTLFGTDSRTVGMQLGTAAPAVWYRPPPDGGVSAPALDGATAYFLRGTGRDRNNRYRSIEVVSAPVPTGPAVAMPRPIVNTRLHWMTDPIAGQGHVAWTVPTGAERGPAPPRSAVIVLDVARGRRVRFELPSGLCVVRLLYVDASELGLEVAKRPPPDRGTSADPMSPRYWRVSLSAFRPD